jgi:cell division protein FtsQ
MRVRRRNRRTEGERGWQLPRINWRRLASTLAGCAAIGAVIALVVWALDQPITTIAVEGSFQHVSAADVEEAVRQRVHGAGLVTIRLDAVQRAIRKLPWVDGTSVQRAWPRGLRVQVVEQVAAARWGENGLLNTRGELFMSEARHMPPELPRLSGPPGSEAAVAQRYLAVQGRLVEAGMRLAAVRLDARGAWEFDLDNGVTVRLGRRQVDERSERFFATALKLLAQRAADIAYVDMRYTNGFAIGWRSGGKRVAAGSRPDSDNSNA